MNKEKTFKIHSIDNGFCRVNYIAKNNDNKQIYYCLQDEGIGYGGVCCYHCSNDFEPSYLIKYNRNRFEIPKGNSAIEIIVRNYLNQKEE